MTEDEALGLLRERASAGAAPLLGIVGGTFDPVHVGHAGLGRALLEETGADAVLFIPAGDPSFKQGQVLAPARDRLEMARLAVAGLPRTAASGLETSRPGVTYTVDTLVELTDMCPSGTRLLFAMGADALETLPQWRSSATIARLAEVAYALRAGAPVPDEALLAGLRASGFRLRRLRTRLPEVSSTRVRALVAAGEPVEGLVGKAVAAYIAERGLYRDEASGARGRMPGAPEAGECEERA